MKASLSVLLAALAVAAVPASARADKLDRRLNEEMPAVKKYLDGKGYKAVGVLRFRVQKGKAEPRFDNAPYNGNLATRLENLLVIHNASDEARALGVVHDAGTAAGRAKVGDWFDDEKERKKLFDVSYPLAWGKKRVKADAFLTGLVRVSNDWKKTTFTIQCFDRDDLKPHKVIEFTLDTDRDVLRDLGHSYVVARKTRAALVTKRSADAVNESALESVISGEGKGKSADPTDLAGIEVTVLVDGNETPFRPAPVDSEGPRWQLVSPGEGKPVAFQLRNTTEKTMGVVVKFNGVSTFDEQTQSADKCRKWVIKPGKSATIRGFYSPNDDKKLSLSPFKVLVGDDAKSAKAQLGDKASLIEIDVFAEGAETGGDELEISIRGLPPSKEKKDRGSYKAVRTAMLKSANLKTETTVVKTDTAVVKREIIVLDKDAAKIDTKFKAVDFEGHSVGRLAVKVLPRE